MSRFSSFRVMPFSRERPAPAEKGAPYAHLQGGAPKIQKQHQGSHNLYSDTYELRDLAAIARDAGKTAGG